MEGGKKGEGGGREGAREEVPTLLNDSDLICYIHWVSFRAEVAKKPRGRCCQQEFFAGFAQ